MTFATLKTWCVLVLSGLLVTPLLAQPTPPAKSLLPQGYTTANRPQNNPLDNPRVFLKTSKVSPTLWDLYEEYQQFANQNAWQDYAVDQDYSRILTLIDGKVVIEATAEQDAVALQASLEKLGLERGSAFGRMVSGLLPIASINQLPATTNLRFVQAGFQPYKDVGAVTSQGDAAQGSDLARNVCELDGEGTTVGILSDSYNALGGEEEGIESGDLPGPGNPNDYSTPVNVLADVPGGIDEGRAMAEIVHDVAPGAALAFHTAVLGQPDFANGILRLADEAEADVIVDDIIYFAEPMFQDGIIAQAADQVKGDGVTYLSSAGNNARQSYESDFRPAPDTAKLTEGDGFPIGDYILHDFDPGPEVDVFQRVTVPFSSIISFQWSQAFASACPTSPGAESDLDIFVFTREGDFSSAIFGSTNNNIGADPAEVFGIETDFYAEVYIVIGKFLGIPEAEFEVPDPNPNPERIKYVYFGGNLNEEHATSSSTSYGHSNADGAIAVGAVPYFDTPAFGETEPILEPFSSAGGVPILYTPCGEPIEPEVRMKPEICGPDGGNNTFFGSDIEGDGFPNFFGTSASAPHVAGIVSLMVQTTEGIDPEQVESTLQNTALDMDDPFTPGPDPGFDFGTGYGLVRGINALAELDPNCSGVARLELYNADTDELLRILNDGDEISSLESSTSSLAIRAVTFPETVGSVKITISGSVESSRVENNAPYASFGNSDDDYYGKDFTFGSFEPEVYTVKATAYSESKARGEVLNTQELSFILVDELLTSFTLVDASTDQDIGEITDFTIINTSLFGNDLNIRADAFNEEAIGSVRFALVETDINIEPTELAREQIENQPPFALFGDSDGDYESGNLREAFYLLTATPYSKKRAGGVAGPPITVIFAVSDDGGLPDISEPSEMAARIQVYPNPLNDESPALQVTWKNNPQTSAAPVTLRLMNQQGEELYQQQESYSAGDESLQIDIQKLQLPQGLYFLRVEQPNQAPQITRVLKN